VASDEYKDAFEGIDRSFYLPGGAFRFRMHHRLRSSRYRYGLYRAGCLEDRYAAITETELYQDGDCLLVTGSVEEISADFLPAGYDAHVDVAVLAPDRKVARKRSIRISLAEGVQSDFKVRFPYFAERGTVVRFAYHSDRRLADGAPNCGENAAVLHKSG